MTLSNQMPMEPPKQNQATPHLDAEALLNLQIKTASILICTFISEHNLPFLLADHMTELFKEMFPDSKIAQGITMGHTKCTEVSY